jgi:hypothetical protein
MRSALRRPFRNCNRRCLRGRRRGPNDLSQALTAYRRALRAQRRLARLAPQYFDEAVIQREAENRAERRRWMALWEPALAKAYGVEYRGAEPNNDEKPPMPSPRVQREVDRQLAELQLSMKAGHVSLERHRRRRPHALLNLNQMARLMEAGFALAKMACGMDSPNELPEKITYDDDFTDFKRAYGHLIPKPAAAAESQSETVPSEAAGGRGDAPPTPPAPPSAGSPCPAVESTTPAPNVPAEPPPQRCDAWSRWARQSRRQKK